MSKKHWPSLLQLTGLKKNTYLWFLSWESTILLLVEALGTQGGNFNYLCLQTWHRQTILFKIFSLYIFNFLPAMSYCKVLYLYGFLARFSSSLLQQMDHFVRAVELGLQWLQNNFNDDKLKNHQLLYIFYSFRIFWFLREQIKLMWILAEKHTFIFVLYFPNVFL